MGRDGTHGTYKTYESVSNKAGSVSVLLPGPSHTLAEAALLEKIALQATDLLIKQIVRLVDQADADIRHDRRWSSFAEFSKVLIGHIRFASEPPDKSGFAALFFPNRQIPYSEEIAIVGQ